jgi:hypothetical protein
MTRAQRLVLIVYCLLLAYCCLWIPWRVPVGLLHIRYERVGYGWVWAGPYRSAPVVYDHPAKSADGWQIVAEEDARPPAPTAVPDFPLMTIRFLAATALSAACFLIARMKSSATLN